MFESASLKLHRAEELVRELAEGLSSSVRAEVVPAGEVHGLVTMKFRVTSNPSPRWRAVAGDVLQNLRSSLDAAVWDLVHATGSAPAEGEAGGICFPVTRSRVDFKARSPRWHGGRLDRDHQTIVERLQPWSYIDETMLGDLTLETAVARQPITRLHDLARKDRHRSPHFGFVAPNQVFAEVPDGAKVETFGDPPWRDGSVIATLRRSPDARLPVVRFVPELVFDDDARAFGGVPVVDSLQSFARHARFVLGALADGRPEAMAFAFWKD